MVNVKDVEALNKRIEKCTTERTRMIAKREVLEKTLVAELKEYAEKFGVNLGAKSIEEMEKKIKAEVERVTSEVQKEYDLKLKVVTAIEKGNYEEANSLMGVKSEEPKGNFEAEIQEVLGKKQVVEEEPVVKEEPEAEDDFDFSFDMSEDDSKVEEAREVAEAVTDDLDFGDISGFDDQDSIKLPEVDDEDVEEFTGNKAAANFLSSVKAASTKVQGNSVAEAVEDLDFGGLEVDDSDDLDIEDDFGFGDILKGSKFE